MKPYSQQSSTTPPHEAAEAHGRVLKFVHKRQRSLADLWGGGGSNEFMKIKTAQNQPWWLTIQECWEKQIINVGTWSKIWRKSWKLSNIKKKKKLIIKNYIKIRKETQNLKICDVHLLCAFTWDSCKYVKIPYWHACNLMGFWRNFMWFPNKTRESRVDAPAA